MTSKILLEPETEIESAHKQGTACSPCGPALTVAGRPEQFASCQQPGGEDGGCQAKAPQPSCEPYNTVIDHPEQRTTPGRLGDEHNDCRDKASLRQVIEEVLAATWPVVVSYVAVGLPCGVLAAKSGMTPVMAGILSATYLSGGGQFMISNLWMAGTPMLSLLASVAAISSRFALYSASLAPHLKRFGKRESLAITCCFSEEAYGVTLSKLSEGPSWTAKHALTLNLELLLTWTVSVVAGAFIGGAVDIPTALASFAMTSLFIYLLWSQPHTAGNGVAAAAAAVTVVACKWNGLSGAAVPVAALVGVATALASQTALQGHEKPSGAEDEPLEEEKA